MSPFIITPQRSTRVTVILLSVFPLCSSRLRTSCMTWYRTWTRGRRTWRRGLLCWRPSWRASWVTCRPCRDSSARSSASSTGTSWRCSSSLTTNTAPSARSLCPDGGHPPRPRPPPPRAARAPGECLHSRLLPSYGQVAFIVKPYGFNKYYPKFWWQNPTYWGQYVLTDNFMLWFVFYYLKGCCYPCSGETTTNISASLSNNSKADQKRAAKRALLHLYAEIATSR